MYKINDYVNIKNINKNGYIISLSKKGCNVKLDNNINMFTEFENIKIITNNPNKNLAKTKIKVNFKSSKTKIDFKPEIMLRHQTVTEALYNLELFLYQAMEYNYSQVKIIHGRNGGILRKNIHNYLNQCDFIKDFRLGNYFEGSYGVTIAYFK